MTQRGTIKQAIACLRAGRFVRLAAALGVAAGFAGCASMSEKVASTASELPGIGLPAGAPERPAEQLAYPAVHDMPPPRSAATLTEVEQQKMKNDLIAAREAQRSVAGAPTAAPKKPTRQSPSAIPVASSRTIY